jgi:trimeric autotransporter adhesin
MGKRPHRRLFLLGVFTALAMVASAVPANAGVALLRNINKAAGAGSAPRDFITFKDKVYFAADDGVHGLELWRTDGTKDKTRLFKDIFEGATGSEPTNFAVLGDVLLFWASDADEGREVWRTDGTKTGTIRISSINPGQGDAFPIFSDPDAVPEIVVAGTVAYFAANGTSGRELYRTDGQSVTGFYDINPSGASDPAHLTAYGTTLFFRADDGGNNRGIELFRLDDPSGSPAIIDINTSSAGASSIPRSLEVAGTKLFFSAADGSHGRELWVYDIPTSTPSLVDINTSTPTAASNPEEITAMAGNVYFRANGNLNVPSIVGLSHIELWRSDGSSAGTKVVYFIGGGAVDSNPHELTVAGDLLYFGATQDGDTELWRTNGMTLAEDPTSNRLLEINPSGSSDPMGLRAIGSKVYLAADDGSTGFEPWKSKGTIEETVQVADINPSQGSVPWDFMKLGKKLIFSADDGSHGTEPWVK